MLLCFCCCFLWVFFFHDCTLTKFTVTTRFGTRSLLFPESTQYSQLLPLGDNSDDDEWDDEKLPKGGNSDDENEAHRPEVVIRDTDKLLRGHPLRNNGTAYNFSRKRKATDDSFCTPTRAAILFATVLLCSGAGYMAGFITQGFRAKTIPEPETSRHVIHKRTDNWRTKMPDWGRCTLKPFSTDGQ